MSLTDAINQCDLPALMRHTCPNAAINLGAKGGTICDPRPGMHEQHASFSVWLTERGVWLWKKRGRNEGMGNAFGFLTSLGMTGEQARKKLLEFTQTQASWCDSKPKEPQRNVLAQAREKLTELRPVTQRQVQTFAAQCAPVQAESDAARELQRRGLWPPTDLSVTVESGDLVLVLRDPSGRIMNFKRRRAHSHPKYKLCFAGHGTPPWVNPKYNAPAGSYARASALPGSAGQRAAGVMIIEGEFNAAAAWKVIREHHLDFDVQGLPGTDTWPYLEGLDREVWIYADDDASGHGMRARLQELAGACGATRIRQIPCLPVGQDFCDVLGQQGSAALHAHLVSEAFYRASGERSEDAPVQGEQATPPGVARNQQNALLGQRNLTPNWPAVPTQPHRSSSAGRKE